MSIATIGSALIAKRHELGLEKGQAADKIGMSRTTYSSYEQDAQRPSVDVFPALAEFLNVPMEELLTLYGATCVAAVRSSLTRVMPGESHETADRSASQNVAIEEIVLAEAGSPYESVDSHKRDQKADLDLPDVFEVESSAFEETTDYLGESSHRDLRVATSDHERTADEITSVESAVFAPRPLVIKAPKAGEHTKSSSHKKKKKKKKK